MEWRGEDGLEASTLSSLAVTLVEMLLLLFPRTL